jgi:hypothetical protein
MDEAKRMAAVRWKRDDSARQSFADPLLSLIEQLIMDSQKRKCERHNRAGNSAWGAQIEVDREAVSSVSTVPKPRDRSHSAKIDRRHFGSQTELSYDANQVESFSIEKSHWLK